MANRGRIETLTAEIENRIVLRLYVEWKDCNWTYFKDALRPPQLLLTDTRVRLGEWDAASRSIGIAREAVMTLPWLEVLEILKHEMVHQFVDEVLGGEDRPHGPLFVQACRARGIDPSATLRPDDTPAPSREEDRIIARVRKLLALASSSNQNEAELAASTAQKLILKFNLDLEDRQPESDDFAFAHVGTPSGRVQAYQRRLGSLLIEHFFVRGVWVKTYDPKTDKVTSVLEICGRRENVQMADFVYDFMERTIERLWKAHKKARGITSNKDRRAFYAGAIAGFHGKLDAERFTHREEGLVWKGDAGTDAYTKARFPRLRSIRASGPRMGHAYAEGKSAGRNIVLTRPISETGSSKRSPRALPPKR